MRISSLAQHDKNEARPMAVRAFCNNPQQLLNEIKTAVRAGTVQTWVLDQDGDFTHSPPQWRNKAWFRPSIEGGALVFKILGQQSVSMSSEVYAVYHGRFIEMLLAHFDKKFTQATATALAVVGEYVG
jgi:hypothetical protein